MKRSDIDAFEKLQGQLDGLYAEMSAIAKKSPNSPTNPFKIKLINLTLDEANKLLGKKYQPFAEFEKFDLDDLPSASDVTFIVSQYIECAEKFRADNIFREGSWWYWRPEEPGEPVRTSMPRKLIGKK